MNEQLQEFARNKLTEGLAKCTDGEVNIFNRMYSPDDLEASIKHVVNNMPEDKLDWAMQQVQRTLDNHTARS